MTLLTNNFCGKKSYAFDSIYFVCFCYYLFASIYNVGLLCNFFWGIASYLFFFSKQRVLYFYCAAHHHISTGSPPAGALNTGGA